MNFLRRSIALATFVSLVAATGTALASDPDRVEWSPDWPKFRLLEGIGTIAFAAGTVAFNELEPRTEPHWRGGILFDDWVRGELRGESRTTQANAARVSDYIYLGSLVVPTVIDIGVVALGIHRRADVALQMLLINLQSFGIAGVLSVGSEHLVGRARPYTADCGADGSVRDRSGKPLFNTCGGSQDYLDFFSGHTAAASTMAGLTCVHHQHLPLYGGGVADLAPCVLMVGAALADGAGRLVADKHYASDVIVGWGVGAFAGYVVPSLLHYGFRSGRKVASVQTGGITLMPAPQVYPSGAGLGMVGVF